ncbi:MAG TPA: type II toxin-antitoxin system VapC family toxin [Azospirillum sp.]
MTAVKPAIVVDSSIAVKWVISEADSAHARMMAGQWAFLAPEFLQVEVANILWKHVRRTELTPATASQAMVTLRRAPVTWTCDADLVDDAYRLSGILDHPVYDCLYLALGQRHRVPVVTADRRLVAASQRETAFQGTVLTLADIA